MLQKQLINFLGRSDDEKQKITFHLDLKTSLYKTVCSEMDASFYVALEGRVEELQHGR